MKNGLCPLTRRHEIVTTFPQRRRAPTHRHVTGVRLTTKKGPVVFDRPLEANALGDEAGYADFFCFGVAAAWMSLTFSPASLVASSV